MMQISWGTARKMEFPSIPVKNIAIYICMPKGKRCSMKLIFDQKTGKSSNTKATLSVFSRTLGLSHPEAAQISNSASPFGKYFETPLWPKEFSAMHHLNQGFVSVQSEKQVCSLTLYRCRAEPSLRCRKKSYIFQ